MIHIPEYSLVIRPPQDIIDHVAEFKKRLKDEISGFGSVNALAHITVFNFDADATELEIWKKKIGQFCETVIPNDVTFDRFDSFPPRTFFISPDVESLRYINDVISGFQRFIGLKPKAHAHMSIARGLDIGKLERAWALFENEKLHFEFVCDGFVLRKFNPQDKQYSDVVEKFNFKGKPQPDLFSL